MEPWTLATVMPSCQLRPTPLPPLNALLVMCEVGALNELLRQHRLTLGKVLPTHSLNVLQKNYWYCASTFAGRVEYLAFQLFN